MSMPQSMTMSGTPMTANMTPASPKVSGSTDSPPPTSLEAIIFSEEELQRFLDNTVAATKEGMFWVQTNTESLAEGARDLYGHYSKYTDIAKLTKLLKEFGVRGKAYLKVIHGKRYIILKGAPGLRHLLRGTKYGWANAQIIKYGLGNQLGARAIFRNSVVGVVVLSAINIVETVIRDYKDFIDAAAQLSTDVVKTVAAVVAGAAAVALLPASVPIVIGVGVSVVVGMVVGAALDAVDDNYHITKGISDWLRSSKSWLDEQVGEIKKEAKEQQRRFRQVWSWCNSPAGAHSCMTQLFGGY